MLLERETEKNVQFLIDKKKQLQNINRDINDRQMSDNINEKKLKKKTRKNVCLKGKCLKRKITIIL